MFVRQILLFAKSQEHAKYEFALLKFGNQFVVLLIHSLVAAWAMARSIQPDLQAAKAAFLKEAFGLSLANTLCIDADARQRPRGEVVNQQKELTCLK